jgi:hypothetical protein
VELTESVSEINRQLVDLFGIDTITGMPIFRVVWSNDQLEKRLVDTTDTGIILLNPEVRQVPKYKQWIIDKYVLERLVLIPDVNKSELPSQKLSYEPLWVFMNEKGEALPPVLWACKFVIDTVYAAMGKKSLRKYVDAEEQNPVEEREKRIATLTEELFGDESGLLGTTITGETVAYTGAPKIKES